MGLKHVGAQALTLLAIDIVKREDCAVSYLHEFNHHRTYYKAVFLCIMGENSTVLLKRKTYTPHTQCVKIHP